MVRKRADNLGIQEKTILKNRQRTCIFITLIMGTFVTSMTVTITAIMLPAIMNDLQIETSSAQWLTSGAALISGIMIPIASYLIKRFRSKYYYISAMVIFCIGAFLAACASGFSVLLIGRLIQAVGCGMLMSFTQIVIMTIYPKEKHGTMISFYALGSTVAPIVAPTIGGFVIDILGWRAMFALLFLAGLVMVLLGVFFMKNVTETYTEQFALLPILLSSIGFCGLLVGLGNLSANSLLYAHTGGALLVGLASLLLCVRMQLKSETPFLDLHIFRYPMFRISVIMSIFMYLICMGNGTLLPIFAQSVLGCSATAYALVTLPGAVVMAVITVCSGKIYDRYGPRPLLISGVSMLLLGSVFGLLFHADNSLLHIGLVSCLLSAGTGFLNTPATTMGLSGLHGKERVDGSAVLNMLRQISSSIASTIAILIYTLVSSYFGAISGVKLVYACYVGIAIMTILMTIRFIKNEIGSG